MRRNFEQFSNSAISPNSRAILPIIPIAAKLPNGAPAPFDSWTISFFPPHRKPSTYLVLQHRLEVSQICSTIGFGLEDLREMHGSAILLILDEIPDREI